VGNELLIIRFVHLAPVFQVLFLRLCREMKSPKSTSILKQRNPMHPSSRMMQKND